MNKQTLLAAILIVAFVVGLPVALWAFGQLPPAIGIVVSGALSLGALLCCIVEMAKSFAESHQLICKGLEYRRRCGE